MSNPLSNHDSEELAKRFRRLLSLEDDQELNIRRENEHKVDEPVQDHDSSDENNNLPLSSAAENTSEKLFSNQGDIDLEKLKVEETAAGNSQRPEESSSSQSGAISSSEHPRLKSLPAIDEYGMPLLGRTDRVTTHSTFDSSAQIKNPSIKVNSSPQASNYRRSPRSEQPDERKIARSSKQNRKSAQGPFRVGIGCAIRMALLAVLAGIILIVIGGSFILYEYYKIAATLPSVADLQQKASSFETTRIYDRNGDLLYEILDPTTGRRTFITLDKISPFMVAATIATEDKSFYSHPGFDWTAIVRAFWQNFKEGETISGASTITQQLARNLLLSPEERAEQSYMRKVREALLAAEITRRYTKDQILELYLNEFYYGNLAYGVEAASETYFNTSADKLDLAQASFLAGLPQAPAVYDVYHDREAARKRQTQVLTLMYEASTEQGCIYVSNSPQRVCIDANTAIAAYAALDNYRFNSPDVQIRYPHWVNYIRSILETQFDAQTIYRAGFSVYTSLDPDLQDEAENIVKEQVDSLTTYNASDGALVAIRPSTGEILAMVGSADFYNDAIDGQVNMATSPTRQPGSSIKPITYIAAFEKGWTAATLIWDVPSEFPPSGDPNDPRPPYIPQNYDEKFHGPVRVRSALANSYNIPAVKTLQFVGIYDNPATPGVDGMLEVARRMGITSLTQPDYGLSLTLGGGEVSLLEMTGVYSVIANNGIRIPPIAITRILDHSGNMIFDYQVPTGDQVIRPEHAYLISSILSDDEARTPAFGAHSILDLGFPAAAKTGTSNGPKDNWTFGYTPDLAVGVWVGNADNSPMENNPSGIVGAAPIWSKFMQFAIQKLTNGNPTPFIKPEGIVDRVICSASGTEPSQWCSNQQLESFAADQLPLPSSQDLWSKVFFDTWTGLRASSACPDFTKEELTLNVSDVWAIGWIQDNPDGKAWAEELGFQEPLLFTPTRECLASDPRPIIEYVSPLEGQTISISPLDIIARFDVSADFQSFHLDYGLGDNPVEWNRLVEGNQPQIQPGKVYTWDLNAIPNGMITLRLTMHSIRGGYAEKRLHINLLVSTPTPTITPTSTPTPTPTQTIFPSPTPTATQVPGTTPTPTPGPPIRP